MSLLRTASLAAFLGLNLLASSAFAHSTGAANYARAGASCTGCHQGGPLPTVQLSGPTSLQAGSIGTYTFTITGGAGVTGGMAVSTETSGAQLIPLSGLKADGARKITHSSPGDFVGDRLVYTFELKAPGTNGTLLLEAAGNSTNDSSDNTGDNAATTTLEVQISGGKDDDSPEEGGCNASGGALAAPMGLLLLASALRRRGLRR